MTRKRMHGRRPEANRRNRPAPSPLPHPPPPPPSLEGRHDATLWPRGGEPALVEDGIVYCRRQGCHERLGTLRPAPDRFTPWRCVLIPGYIRLPVGKPRVAKGSVVRFSARARDLHRNGEPVDGPTLTIELPADLRCPCGQQNKLLPRAPHTLHN